MTTFDARERGTTESEWSECAWLRDAPDLPVLNAARLVVLAAHPDDETLGAGGLIARAADAGIEVHVIIASDGAASHPDSPTHTPSQLAHQRKTEVAEAMFVLAPDSTVEFLELPDGDLIGCTTEIAAAVQTAALGRSTLVAPWIGDRHPDHEACARAAREAAATSDLIELLEYPIWAWHWGSPDTELVSLDPASAKPYRLSLDDDLQQRKQRAIAAYATQVLPLSSAPGDQAVLTPDTLEYFARDCECYFRVELDGAQVRST